ncbi:uncharacterized protein LOC119075790 [Bradysia coprophila]|uniref:uncharacterized protein LOC119075790 n=1 Tax=Bradysia coprophila TaxID=38358 RepID=UPI00187D9C0F|nr:uncharacterized protein LOC119075790 [Bradysia coprophila]
MELSTNESSMQIMDLGFHCLENCLRHLTIEELLNVADSNKEMRDTARYVFKRMHGRNLVHFIEVLKFRNGDDERTCECCRGRFFGRLRSSDKTIEIRQLKLGLQFLRCFGDLFSEIEFRFCFRQVQPSSSHCQSRQSELIQFHRAHEWEPLLIGYINEYCSESLTKIEFYGKDSKDYSSHDLIKLTKPFVKVEKLICDVFFLAKKKLHELFPKLRELELRSVCFSEDMPPLDNEYIANCFPYLEHLTINLSDMNKCNRKNFAIALRLNPQIKTLAGNIWFEVLFDADNFHFWNGNEDFQNLEKLQLKIRLHANPKLRDILMKPVSEDLHFKNLKELNVDFGTDVYDDTVWTFLFFCDKLESLTISSNCELRQFSNLLNKHPTVKKLDIDNYADIMSSDDCLRISRAFPLLEEILFGVEPDDFVAAIEMFPSLKCFKYLEWKEKSCDVINRLRPLNGWSVSNTNAIYNTRLIEGKRHS